MSLDFDLDLDLGGEEVPRARERPGRKQRARKTLSPGKVNKFLTDFDLQGDALLFPDPPSELGVAPPTIGASRASPAARNAKPSPSRPPLTPVRGDRELGDGGGTRCAATTPLNAGKENSPAGFSPSIRASPSGSRRRSSSRSASPVAFGSPGGTFAGSDDAVPMVPRPTRGNKRDPSRRRSYLPPSAADLSSPSPDPPAARPERPSQSVRGSRGHTPSGSREGSPAPAPAPANCTATATDGFMHSPLDQNGGLGWSLPEGGTTDMSQLCREFHRARAGSQQQRRIAARAFVLSGYPLGPLAAMDAEQLCTGEGGWGSESTEGGLPLLTGVVQPADSKESIRGLIKRLKPVLEVMDERNRVEKQELERGIQVVPKKRGGGGYEYETLEHGAAVSQEEYVARYTQYIVAQSKSRRAEIAAKMGWDKEALPTAPAMVPPQHGESCTRASAQVHEVSAETETCSAGTLPQEAARATAVDAALALAEMKLWDAWETALEAYHKEVARVTQSAKGKSLQGEAHLGQGLMLHDMEGDRQRQERGLGVGQSSSGTGMGARSDSKAPMPKLTGDEPEAELPVCELCYDKAQETRLVPCSHQVCGGCAEKMRSSAEMAGVTFCCPW
ncbi:unnamed protein product, partial [Chrysoparadoxa australica]